MADLPRLLRDALPDTPATLDMAAVEARSRRLDLRRRLAKGAGAGLAVAGVALAVVVPGEPADRLKQAGPGTPRTAPSAPDGRVVQLHFTTGCGDISPVERRVAGPVLQASLQALFAGPTPEEAARGADSTFGPGTAALLRSVRTANGSAYVDLDGALRGRVELGPDGAGCSNFAEQVGGTLRQFGGIAAVYYAYDGDPAAFVEAAGGTCPVPPEPGGLCDSAPFSASAGASPGRGEPQPEVGGACWTRSIATCSTSS